MQEKSENCSDRCRNQYLSRSSDRWSYRKMDMDLVYLTDLFWWFQLSKQKYYCSNYQVVPEPWGAGLQLIWSSRGKPATGSPFPICQTNGLAPPNGEHCCELFLFPLFSTVVHHLNLGPCPPFASSITNFPAKTMLLVMQRREGQFCFWRKPREGRNKVCCLLYDQSQGWGHGKSSGRMCWRKGGRHKQQFSKQLWATEEQEQEITQKNGTVGPGVVGRKHKEKKGVKKGAGNFQFSHYS